MQKYFVVEQLKTEAEARLIIDFLLSENSFDDQRHTPGEMIHFQTHPFKAIGGEYIYQFIRNEMSEILGVSGFVENEQRSGGYYWDYIVVHKRFRNQGIAMQLSYSMMQLMKSANARYIITYTCNLDCYRPVRKLFERLGFSLAGSYPDYYFEGEDRLIYYLKL